MRATPPLVVTGQPRQHPDEPHGGSRLVRARAVPVTSIPLASWHTTASPVHATNTPAPNRMRAAGQSGSLGLRRTPRGRMRLLHGVDVHFPCTPTPTGWRWSADPGGRPAASRASTTSALRGAGSRRDAFVGGSPSIDY